MPADVFLNTPIQVPFVGSFDPDKSEVLTAITLNGVNMKNFPLGMSLFHGEKKV